jgi:hypothetical protein
MARGLGSALPSSRHDWVKALSSSVFIGEPCPMKAAGIGADGSIACSSIR